MTPLPTCDDIQRRLLAIRAEISELEREEAALQTAWTIVRKSQDEATKETCRVSHKHRHVNEHVIP